MAQDDRNPPLATLSGGSLAISVTGKLAASDVDRCLARLAVAYGDDRRIADADTHAMLRREWLEALGHLEPHVVNSALGKVIRECKFWPSIAEVTEACKTYDFRSAEEKYGARCTDYTDRGPRPIGNVRADFCREGRTVEEEIAHREAKLVEMKRQHAYTPALDYEPVKSKPASQEMWISDQLKASAKKHGYWKGADQ